MLLCSARDYYGDSEAVPNSNKTRQKEVEHTTQGKCVHSVPIKYAPALVNNCEFLIYPWEKITAFRFRSCNHVQAFSPGSVHSATQVLKLFLGSLLISILSLQVLHDTCPLSALRPLSNLALIINETIAHQ